MDFNENVAFNYNFNNKGFYLQKENMSDLF